MAEWWRRVLWSRTWFRTPFKPEVLVKAPSIEGLDTSSALLHWTASLLISMDASVAPGVKNPVTRFLHGAQQFEEIPARLSHLKAYLHTACGLGISLASDCGFVYGPLCQCIVASLALPDSVCLDHSVLRPLLAGRHTA